MELVLTQQEKVLITSLRRNEGFETTHCMELIVEALEIMGTKCSGHIAKRHYSEQAKNLAHAFTNADGFNPDFDRRITRIIAGI